MKDIDYLIIDIKNELKKATNKKEFLSGVESLYVSDDIIKELNLYTIEKNNSLYIKNEFFKEILPKYIQD